MANTIDWGKATQNNTNGFGKYQNTIDAGSIYADSYSGETTLVGTSAAFSYSKSSFHQDESDPTPTITGTAGGVFVGTTGTIFVDSGTNTASSTGQIDLSASTIDSHIITYTVGGVQANQTVGITASPFIANNFSMQFDSASSQYIDAGNPTSLQITGALSISAWVKFTGNDMALVTKANTSGTERSYGIWVDRFGGGGGGNTPVFFINSSGTIYETPGTGARVDDGNWHHLVGVFNPSTSLQLYIDGVLEQENTTSIPATIDNDNVNFNIGRAANGTFYYNGKADEVAVWNAALSSDAVTEIYNATANNTGKALDLSTDTGNYTNSSSLQYWNRLGD